MMIVAFLVVVIACGCWLSRSEFNPEMESVLHRAALGLPGRGAA
jgi:hypothetical protein